ncbi:uncharacterized protein CHSO_2006 [Chryseobacterium sp. StRB126]|uniref:hypothetical protein n=1 Tax=Chryseobacterium sp. StRB126 TaxID=878220 RepID=UPI0004E99899|nr:hypothetical protein [Chryseobacterium sp. StRB126]BAP31043.1 uncharacterized protein CHSO_2006 [Chryseobacterium sp. StRB126]
MSLALDKPHTFESKFKNIKLIATEFDEPFYGFTLWRFRLYVDDNLLMNPLLDYEGKGCGLEADLEKFKLESGDGAFVFIPYGLITMNTHDLSLKKYDAEIGTNNTFIENNFWSDKLFVLRQRSVWVVDLKEQKLLQKTYPFEKLKFEKMWRQGDNVKFLYKDKLTGEAQTLEYSLENKNFINDVV